MREHTNQSVSAECMTAQGKRPQEEDNKETVNNENEQSNWNTNNE